MTAVTAGVRYMRPATFVAAPRRISTKSRDVAPSDSASTDQSKETTNGPVNATSRI